MTSLNPDICKELYVMKLKKLEEQKSLSDRMNEILCKRGGLIDGSTESRRNLKAAIAGTRIIHTFRLF